MNVFKKLSRPLFLLLAFSPPLICLAQPSPLLNEGVLKVGIEASYPPFEAFDLNSNIIGIDPDFVMAIAKQMNVKPDLIDTKFTSLIFGLGKKYDIVISGMYITPTRQQKAITIPYMLSGASIITWNNSVHKPETPDQLCGLNVGLQQGNAWVTDLKNHSTDFCLKKGLPPIHLLEFPTAPEVSQALLSKNVDVQLEIAPAAKRIVKMSRGRLVITSRQLIYPLPMGIFIDKNNPQLGNSVQTALNKMQQNGQYSAILAKYDLATSHIQ